MMVTIPAQRICSSPMTVVLGRGNTRWYSVCPRWCRICVRSMHDSHRSAVTAPLSALELRPLCESEVAKLCKNFPEISLAVVATADARMVTCQFNQRRNGDRVAAMVGSLLALCESLSKELSGGTCQSALISMNACNCVIVHVQGRHQSLVLAIGVGQDVMLALARRLALDLADRLSTHLKAAEADRSLLTATH
jgi:predicted regulator of Ras-like GTPase activity (Roadblock/LC7/MglB family)